MILACALFAIFAVRLSTCTVNHLSASKMTWRGQARSGMLHECFQGRAAVWREFAEPALLEFSRPGRIDNQHSAHGREIECLATGHAERAEAWMQAEARLQHIFRAADLQQPTLASLYEAVRAFRRS